MRTTWRGTLSYGDAVLGVDSKASFTTLGECEITVSSGLSIGERVDFKLSHRQFQNEPLGVKAGQYPRSA